jgi:hypothetical protein
MRFENLPLALQLFSTAILALFLAALVVRALMFIRRTRAGQRSNYPSGWSAEQCKAFERFRLVLGMLLIPAWGLSLYLIPLAPRNWPFGFMAPISTIIASHAWVVLLAARGWKSVGAFSPTFGATMLFLVTWWATLFLVGGWIFAKASAPPPPRGLPGPIYAAVWQSREVEPLDHGWRYDIEPLASHRVATDGDG